MQHQKLKNGMLVRVLKTNANVWCIDEPRDRKMGKLNTSDFVIIIDERIIKPNSIRYVQVLTRYGMGEIVVDHLDIDNEERQFADAF